VFFGIKFAIIFVLIILGILASVAVSRFNNLEDNSKQTNINSAISDLNGRESLTWANQNISTSAHNDNQDILDVIDCNLGSHYTWTVPPDQFGGILDGILDHVRCFFFGKGVYMSNMRTIDKENGGVPIRIKEVHAESKRLHTVMWVMGTLIFCELAYFMTFLIEEVAENGIEDIDGWVFDWLINLF